jgi:hypothetical protein
MSQSEHRCPSCGGEVRVLDHYCDYSTTRGPMTSYDVTFCDACEQMSLSLRSAQHSSV